MVKILVYNNKLDMSNINKSRINKSDINKSEIKRDYYIRDYYALLDKNELKELYQRDEDDNVINYEFIPGLQILKNIYTTRNYNLDLHANFLIPGLRHFYQENDQFLSSFDKKLLYVALRYPIPLIKNDKLTDTITKFDLVSVKLSDIKKSIDARLPIELSIPFKNFRIYFLYEARDFWDSDKNKLYLEI